MIPPWWWFRYGFFVFVISVVVGYVMNIHIPFAVLYGIFCFLGVILVLFLRMQTVRFIVILSLLATCGFTRGSFDSQDVIVEQHLDNSSHISFFFDGEVLSEPRLTSQVQIIPVFVQGFRDATHVEKWKSTSLRMKIITHHGKLYHEGDHITIECIPQLQKSYGLKGVILPQSRDITCFYPFITKHGFTKSIGYQFWKWRSGLTHTMSEMVSGQTTGFLAGILFGGGDELISKHTKELFQKTGTSHILAISGYNVSLVSMVFFWIFCFFHLSRKTAGLISVIAIFAFVFLTGAHAASLRAAGMASAVLFAHFFGRQSSSLAALCIVAGGMIIFAPATFLFDAGFHLSFLATLGLVYGLSSMSVRKNSFRRSCMLLAKQTLLAIGITTPYVLFVFGTISLISPFVNMIVVPFVPLLMIISASVLIGAYTGNPFLMWTLSTLAEGVTRVWMSVIEWFSQFPFAAATIPQTPWNSVLLYGSYALIIFVVWVWKRKKLYDRMNAQL